MGLSSASSAIRENLERVSALRLRATLEGEAAAVNGIKRLQAQRFAGTYADWASTPDAQPALRFFLDELYGEHDFSRRDEQFGRIAGALERLFPDAVAQLAVDLSEMHALTEELDHELARQWLSLRDPMSPSARYLEAWRHVGRSADRYRQLAVIQHMGAELERLTKRRSLRLALGMMRRPAQAAGLDSLQHFLESGFDAFALLRDPKGFLRSIAEREAHWINMLFNSEPSVVRPLLEAAWLD